MSNFAVIKDNKVFNVIVADTKETAEEATQLECVAIPEGTNAHIGLGYDGSTFEQPAEPDLTTKPDDSSVQYIWDYLTKSWVALN